MDAHRIRLQAPWRSEPVEDGIRWTRSFHRPTNLGSAERVWVVVANPRCDGTAWLNSRPLGSVRASVEARFEITAFLTPYNELAILFLGPSPDCRGPDLPAEICLEIG